jgi:hypothetical protein
MSAVARKPIPGETHNILKLRGSVVHGVEYDSVMGAPGRTKLTVVALEIKAELVWGNDIPIGKKAARQVYIVLLIARGRAFRERIKTSMIAFGDNDQSQFEIWLRRKNHVGWVFLDLLESMFVTFRDLMQLIFSHYAVLTLADAVSEEKNMVWYPFFSFLLVQFGLCVPCKSPLFDHPTQINNVLRSNH